MKPKIIFLLLSMLITSGVFSQESYPRYILDTLCSPDMHGRGYYEKGDSLAADFIAAEYKNIELSAFKTDFFQQFTLPANSIEGKLSLIVNKKEFVPGEDFIVSPASPPIDGSFKVKKVDPDLITDFNRFKKFLFTCKGEILWIESDKIEDKGQLHQITRGLQFSPKLPIAGIITTSSDSLIYTASQEQAHYPLWQINARSISEIPKKVSVHIESTHYDKYTSQNVIGYIEGEVKDSFVCVTAHYDHLGRMGKDVYFPGANDNASGTAMLLSIAKEFSTIKPKYTLVFMAFGAEEIGLVGSKYYVDNPYFPLSNIRFLINLDILGTGDDGIQIVNSAIYSKQYERIKSINEKGKLLKQIKIRGERCNSDHCFFYEKGVPSFFIYTLGGVAHYHNIYDKSETLPLTEFEDLKSLLIEFISKF